MSTQRLGATSLIAAWCVLAIGGYAQPEVAAQELTAEQRIEAALGQRLKTPLAYEAEQLDIVLENIADEYGISIVFDRAALDDIAISPESEVSVQLQNISLRSALELMLKEPGLEDLCYTIDEEVLLITTQERRNEKLKVIVYRVDDLIDGSRVEIASGAASSILSDRLIDILIASVEQDSWSNNGKGKGEIQFFPPGMLIVSQTHRVHEEVEKLLDTLRSTRQQIITESSQQQAANKPLTRGFLIYLNLGKDPQAMQSRLAAAVKGSVDWQQSGVPEQEVWLDVLPDRVLVHHVPKVLTQVEQALSDMQMLKAMPVGGFGGGGFGGRGFGGGGGGF